MQIKSLSYFFFAHIPNNNRWGFVFENQNVNPEGFSTYLRNIEKKFK